MAFLDFFKLLFVAYHIAKQDKAEWSEREAIRRVQIEISTIKYRYGIIEIDEFRQQILKAQIEGGHSKRSARRTTNMLLQDYITHGETMRGVQSAEDYEVENLKYLFQTKKLPATNIWKKRSTDLKQQG